MNSVLGQVLLWAGWAIAAVAILLACAVLLSRHLDHKEMAAAIEEWHEVKHERGDL